MNRDELQRIAEQRVREARVLLENECYPGAYYLLGYAIECALKACIAKQIRRYDFPDKKLVDSSHVHDLEQLLSLSGVKFEFEDAKKTNPKLANYWSVVKDWKETSRYTTDTLELSARDLYKAVTARKDGVLSWLKKRW